MDALPRRAAWSWFALLFFGCGSTQPPERDADAPLTAAESCRTRPERCNARDDDCDGIIDEDADSSCGLPHASSSCVQGTCVIERCSEGYHNCNQLITDGCEGKGSCEPAVMTAEAMSGNMSSAPSQPDQASPDAGRASAQTSSEASQPGAAGQSGPATDDADSGVPPNDAGEGAPTAEADAGAACEPERCDGQDNDCDTQVDEGTTCVACVDSAPTGQGRECDRCVCESCAEALAGCTGTMDDEWNLLCGDVLTCFGKSVQAGLCTGSDSDCFQNGDGPCAAEFRAAFQRGWACTADPVRTPCGGLTRVRLECYRSKCAAFCKA
jgi:hypothetical protein